MSDTFDPQRALDAVNLKAELEEARLQAGKLMEDGSDRLAAIRNSLKAMPMTTNMQPSMVLSEDLVLHWRSTNVKHNTSDALARKHGKRFELPAGTIATRMPGDVYRFEFGLKRLFVSFTTRGGWVLQSHENFVKASGRIAGMRSRGSGPDRSIER